MEFDLPSLETFVRLADCGSFSEVARTQEISQPAASIRVAKLESAVGLRLLTRQPEGIHLTVEGRDLLVQARRILDEHRRLECRMERYFRESRGVVKVVIDGSITGRNLAALLSKPTDLAATLEIVSPGPATSWHDALRQDEVDLVISATFQRAGDQPSLKRYDLERQKGTTIAWNRTYFDFDPQQFNFPDVLRSTILIPSERLVPGYQPFLERWCQDSYGTQPPDILVFDDETTAHESCCVGLGVLIFPGDVQRRMNRDTSGLGIVKAFNSLLPDAYNYSIFMRSGEKNAKVLKTAMKIAELYPSVAGRDRDR